MKGAREGGSVEQRRRENDFSSLTRSRSRKTFFLSLCVFNIVLFYPFVFYSFASFFERLRARAHVSLSISVQSLLKNDTKSRRECRPA